MKPVATLLSALIACVALSACEGSPVRNRMELGQSKRELKACLAANPGKPDACSTQYAAYQADLGAAQTTEPTMSALARGVSTRPSSTNVTVNNGY
ncbi:hypothetical protein [Paraburkholderia unamae]|uniref:Uncharacterized protein n=1 Tax=Paraburkholderia unamae TaxID=219649 RepID=A0ACC6RHX2_9BURK